jgi:hypothetical protein
MKARRVMLMACAAALSLALLLLFDYCGYEIDHHPDFDLVHWICTCVRGVITTINLIAMWKLLESFVPPAGRSAGRT